MPRSALLLAAVVALTASVAGEPQRAAGDMPFQTIRGRVVADDAADAAQRRVEVALTADNFAADPVYTDEQGRFEVAVPALADYSLRFTKAGFAPHAVQRAAASPNGDLQIRLARGAVVTGRVADQFGDPVLAAIRLRRVADPAGAGAGALQTVVRTDDRGEFRIGGRDAGRYEIVVDPLGGAGDAPPAVEAGAPVVVDLRAGQETTVNLSARVTAE